MTVHDDVLARAVPTHASLPERRTGARWTPAEELTAQLDGITAWLAEDRVPEPAADATREQLMDWRRVRDARGRERDGLVHRLDVGPAQRRCRRTGRPPTALVVHRQEWFSRRLADALTGQGLDVLAVLEDGAAAVGAVLAEQPDLVVAEDKLPSVGGWELAERLAVLAPHTVVVVQVRGSLEVVEAARRGAYAVVHGLPPALVAEELAAVFSDPGRSGSA